LNSIGLSIAGPPAPGHGTRFGAARFILTGTYFDPAGFSTFNHGDSGFHLFCGSRIRADTVALPFGQTASG
jgi:hypothetical protein